MKQKKFVIAIIILLIFVFAWRVANNKPPTLVPATTSTPDVEFAAEYDSISENHALALEIIGPEGDKIFPAQARMYEAYIKGNAKYESAKINCHWKFYLNENNQEVLFEEMDNSSSLGEAERKICGFTSTFMNRPGQLRVELTAELTTFAGEPLESVVTERFYLVAK